MKLTIVIGCFNEKPTILKAIEQAKAINIDKEIIVIDNCSTDGTKEILQGLLEDKDLKIILHPKNFGAGYTGIEGIQLAKGDYIFQPGADLEYRMDDVYKMIELIEGDNLDAVFGSRLTQRRGESIWQLIKERPFWLGTIIGTFMVNLLYGRKFTDIIAVKLIKVEIVRKLNCRANSQAFEFELVSRLCKAGYKIGEVGVWYKPRSRKEGKTISAFDMLPAMLAILKVRFFNR